jgi:hypothetical protein
MQGWYYLRMAEAENDIFLQARKFKVQIWRGGREERKKRKEKKRPMRPKYFISW